MDDDVREDVVSALKSAAAALEVYAGTDQHSLGALSKIDRALARMGVEEESTPDAPKTA